MTSIVLLYFSGTLKRFVLKLSYYRLWSSYNTLLSAKMTKDSNPGPVNEQISNYLNNDNLFTNFSLGKKAENSCFLAD